MTCTKTHVALFAAMVLALGLRGPGQGREASGEGPRREISLDGKWLFQRDGAAEWKEITVPSSFEAHEGTEFDGVGWYRKELEHPPIPDGKRALLHFQAAATEAEVFLDGQKLGTHLGGWTPFRFDVTDLLRKATAGKAHEIKVRLDEKVGHNTQGFLPIVAPHFGGIWQSVKLVIVPETYIDDLRLKAIGNPGSGRLEIELLLQGNGAKAVESLTVRHRRRGARTGFEKDDRSLVLRRDGNVLEASLDIPGFKLWSPSAPELYDVEIELPGEGRDLGHGDVVAAMAAFRSIEVFGTQLRLNGKPLGVRGLLNWGYHAPLTAPNPSEETLRSDLEFARSRGFNLMKFCLWVPPKRYLELADEMGILTWMEYPTWHPQLTRKFIEPLRREFSEFFLHDRNHPSVILRSLTCETGPGAELKVIQELYDLAHAMIPGAVVEDDSSWIGWNRVHDFYDDHPYGNNHTWVQTLRGLNEHILARGPKPLVLGEAIAADTWVDRKPLLDRVGETRPFWLPGFFDDAPRWVERMRGLYGAGGLDVLIPESLRYALLMRKYQVEAFRREVPYGGYVISVIRDVPLCSMGLLDYQGRPKWSEEDWEWQRDRMMILDSEADRRSFSGSERLRGRILLSHFGPEQLESADLVVTLEGPEAGKAALDRAERKGISQNPGTLARVLDLDFALPPAARPERVAVQAVLSTAGGALKSQWPLWVVPPPVAGALARVSVHPSLRPELAAELFPGATRLDAPAGGPGASPPAAGPDPAAPVVATRLDDDVVKILDAGGKVLILPDGGKGSFPMSAHWFLRGAPFVPEHALSQEVPRDLLVDLQHFDLAGDVIPEVGYLDSIDPILMLWDTHDRKMVATHGLIFEAKAGRGRLLVSAVRHHGSTNAAGKWLLSVLLEHLASGPEPRRGFSGEIWQYVKDKLHEDKRNLVEMTWKLKPDPKDEGVAGEWFSPALAVDGSWKDIRVGASWESQGFPALDGWAWYRLAVKVPESWRERRVYLSFEGVDDLYELYVGGRLVAKCGDLATRKDTFNEKRSHDITSYVTFGDEALVAVRVHDWYGAGGIFRPVTLGTTALGSGPEILKN